VWKQKHYAERYQIQSREDGDVILVDGMYSAAGVSLQCLDAVSVMTAFVDFEDALYPDAVSAIVLVVDSGGLLSFVPPLLL